MAVKIRLARFGKKKKPFYRIVVAENTSPRDGRYIDLIGTYEPKTDPAMIAINREKALRWISKGAKPTQSADQILRKGGLYKS